MKRYIRSFAVTKREVQADLRAAAKVIIEHLIKIFLYPDAQEKGHWKREVAAALNDVPKMKGSNKLLKAKFILDSSWMAWEDIFDAKVAVVKKICQKIQWIYLQMSYTLLLMNISTG